MGAERINDLARRQILGAAQQALKRADAFGVTPTPLDDVGEAIGVAEVIDIADLPEDLVVSKPLARVRRLRQGRGTRRAGVAHPGCAGERVHGDPTQMLSGGRRL